MSPELTALPRRAVSCPKWRWMPGMRWWTEDDRGRLDDFQPEYMGRPPDALPDLTDPATVGCLLSLARAAWADPKELWGGWVGILRDHRSLFFVVRYYHNENGALCEKTIGSGPTEAEALVSALEAAL